MTLHPKVRFVPRTRLGNGPLTTLGSLLEELH
jgi:hypothetical protein